MIARTNTLRALQIGEEMKKEAFEDQCEYGILLCMRTLGDIYVVRKNYALAGQCYKEALDYMQKNVTGQDESSLYRSLALCNRNLESYTTALDLIAGIKLFHRIHEV